MMLAMPLFRADLQNSCVDFVHYAFVNHSFKIKIFFFFFLQEQRLHYLGQFVVCMFNVFLLLHGHDSMAFIFLLATGSSITHVV